MIFHHFEFDVFVPLRWLGFCLNLDEKDFAKIWIMLTEALYVVLNSDWILSLSAVNIWIDFLILFKWLYQWIASFCYLVILVLWIASFCCLVILVLWMREFRVQSYANMDSRMWRGLDRFLTSVLHWVMIPQYFWEGIKLIKSPFILNKVCVFIGFHTMNCVHKVFKHISYVV